MFPWEDKPLRVAATGWHAAACPSPATSPAHSPVPSVGRGGEGEAASVGTSGRPPLQEQRGRLQEGPGPGGSPSPVCSWGRGGSRGLRGREHPGVRCLALAQGATGIGAATEREYRARGAGGTAQEPSCRLPRAAPPRSAPAARGEPQWVWTGRPQRTCAGLAWALCSVAPPSRLLAPGWLDRAGCPQREDRDRGRWRQALQELVASLGCGLFPGSGRLEPGRQHDPHPQQRS